MKQLFDGLVWLRFVILVFPVLSFAQSAPARLGGTSPVVRTAGSSPFRQVKLSHFELQSSAIITSPGDSLSSAQYRSANYWYPVTIPSTVLTGLVANKVYPDPYTGMNNMLIPDASDTFNQQYHLEKYSHLPNEPIPGKNRTGTGPCSPFRHPIKASISS